ncbi:hypothetical protein OEZ85_012692 [Tetradesmus obliquus]|uniref:Clp R domain-containing protein n=1 Tax=Tetradesmus obliquus TaxID=3088 RepID=A0ABY8U431_TETOB|nr:hypothetical protein OEZ85_012692 [Tetradesmus obliquus]
MGGQEEQEQQVRLLAAEAAFDAGEAGIAQHLLLGLAAAGYPPAWRLAAEMACPDRYADQSRERAARAQQLRQQQELVEQQLAQEEQQQQDTDAAVAARRRHSTLHGR